MKSKTQQNTTGPTGDGHGDTPYYEQNLAAIEAKKERKRKREEETGIDKEVLDQMNRNFTHGPTWGDHTEGKRHWTGYFQHRNEKLKKQCTRSDRSIYGDLSSNGVHYDKQTISKHHEDRLKSAKRLHATKSRVGDDSMSSRRSREKESEYDISKRRRLNHEEEKEHSADMELKGIFEGVTVYFNGRTEDLSNYHLKKVVVLNGGSFRVNMSKDVTHVITNNLCRSKINRAVDRMGKARANQAFYVRAGWITDSMRNGKRMKEKEYLVFKTKKYGDLQSYFAAK